MRVRLICAVAALTLSGCSFGPSPAAPVAIYDFGPEAPQPVSTRVRSTLALDDVSVQPHLHTSAILYRLTYLDAAQLQPYARSRWAAPPSALLNQRLRLAFGQAAERGIAMVSDGIPSEHVLRIELDAFEQLVDSPSAGRVLIRARASLISNPERRLRAQRIFVIERTTPSVDAQGAVRGLSAGTDELIAQLIGWVAREAVIAR